MTKKNIKDKPLTKAEKEKISLDYMLSVIDDNKISLPKALGIIIILFGFGAMVGALIVGYPPQESIQDICLNCNRIYGDGLGYDVDEIFVLIDKIDADCGSTYITKRFGSDEWQIFKEIANENGYTKFDYIKLSDCLEVTE